MPWRRKPGQLGRAQTLDLRWRGRQPLSAWVRTSRPLGLTGRVQIQHLEQPLPKGVHRAVPRPRVEGERLAKDGFHPIAHPEPLALRRGTLDRIDEGCGQLSGSAGDFPALHRFDEGERRTPHVGPGSHGTITIGKPLLGGAARPSCSSNAPTASGPKVAQTIVEDLDHLLAANERHEQVRGRQIAMRHGQSARVRQRVGLLQSACHRSQHAHQLAQGDGWSLLSTTLRNDGVEAPAIEPFESEERHPPTIRSNEAAHLDGTREDRSNGRQPYLLLGSRAKCLEKAVSRGALPWRGEPQTFQRHPRTKASMVGTVDEAVLPLRNHLFHQEGAGNDLPQDAEEILCHGSRHSPDEFDGAAYHLRPSRTPSVACMAEIRVDFQRIRICRRVRQRLRPIREARCAAGASLNPCCAGCRC